MNRTLYATKWLAVTLASVAVILLGGYVGESLGDAVGGIVGILGGLAICLCLNPTRLLR